MISSDRSWTPHIQTAVLSTRTMAAWIYSALSDRTSTLLMPLFNSLVRSRLEYCCAVWNPEKVSDIKSLEEVQRMFTIKVIVRQQLDYWESLVKVKLLSLQRRRERYCIGHIWKILHELVPNDIDMTFTNNPRHGLKAVLPTLNIRSQSSVRSDYENSFRINAARLRNLLQKVYLGSFPDTPLQKLAA